MIPALTPSSGSGLANILVVDDDEVDRVTLRRYLAAAGMSSIIDELADGHDLVTRMKEYPYDCLILDHRLADETGLDVIARLRAAGVSTPILCVAAQDEDVGAALVAAGATDFLAKRDLSPARLVRRLRYALRLGFAEREANQVRAEWEEQRRLLNAVVARLPTGLAVVDAALTHVLVINQPAEHAFEARGATLRDGSTQLAAMARALMAEAFATRTTAHLDKPVLHADRLFRIGAAAVQDDDYRVIAGVIVTEDVTDLVESTKIAERFHRAYQDVLAIASNDLRGPLSAISMALDGLADDAVVGPERERYALSVKAAVERASRLISDLLTADQIEAGTFQARLDVVSVRRLLEDVARDHEQVAHHSGMSIRTVVDPSVGHVLADREHLQHALANLIANALRHARGAGVIELEARPAGRFVELIVRDHGPGVPEDERARLFDSYWLDGERQGGAGLGLAIVQGIAQAHGGRVAVADTDGGGATFTLTVPAAEARPAS